MKPFLLLIIAASSGLTGVMLGLRLVARCRALGELIALISQLREELRFSLAPSEAVVAAVLKDRRFAGSALLQCCHKATAEGESFPEAWRRATALLPDSLAKEDILCISEIASIMGSGDIETQLMGFGRVLQKLGQSLETARQKRERQFKLYCSIGVLSGIFIVIVLA